jgi:hypothetical protein
MHRLLIKFDTNDPEFARGFEVGRIYALLEEGSLSTLRGLLFHATNAEMLLRAADRHGVEIRATSLDDTWMEITHAEHYL